MIPVKLTLQGIYSYQQTPQTIEFGPLLEAGNFGIFGAVGSGKSSILEAISFVLYGDIERLNRREDRNYNMMNLKSDRLVIDFQFRNYDGELFRFECEGRRNSKNFRDVPTYRRKASKWEDDQWIPLDHADGETATGITYQNFKRTVIVPQGHFQDFLGLTPGDRSQMLQELFHLDKYDLAEPTKKLADRNAESLHRIQGRLVGYEQVTAEYIARVEQELLDLREKHQNATQALQRLSRDLEASTALKQLYDKSEDLKKRYLAMMQQADDIARAGQRIKLLQEARQQFSHRFSQIDGYRQSIKQTGQQITDLTQRTETVQKRAEEVHQQFQVLQKALDGHSDQSAKFREYALAANWSVLHKEYITARARVEKGQKVILKLQQEIRSKENETGQLEKELRSLATATKNRELLIELKNRFARRQSLLEQRTKIEARQREASQKMQTELSGFCEKYEVRLPESGGLPDISSLEIKLHEVKRHIGDQTRALSELNIQSELAKYVARLASGHACPLCGSTDHPAPAHIESVQDQMEQTTRLIREGEKAARQLEAGQVEWKHLEKNMQQFGENQRHSLAELRELEMGLKELEDYLRLHQDKYPHSAAVTEALEESERTMVKIKSLESRLEVLRKTTREESEKLDTYRSKINEINHLAERKGGEMASVETQLGEAVKSELESRTSQEWKELSASLEHQIISEREEFRKLSLERDRISQEHTQLKTNLESNKAFLEREMNQLLDAEKQLDQLLNQSSFESMESIREILQLRIDVEAEQDRIARYERDIHVLEVALSEVKTQIDGREFDLHIHENLVKLHAAKEEKSTGLREQVLYHTKRVEELGKQLKARKKLEEESNALQLRAENLKVLEGLFKGKKFVDYVSTVYLREICEIANRRFRKLTNNHFALILAEDNQFQIRDFLHDGQIRSVKTLSGGQIFQVSLCLALALAESIQSRTQSRQNFFFLDEGFGTLDGDALSMVMETLKSLRQEGRVIGLISHVASLKQEMDMHLHIVNDPEKGSQIRKSYVLA